MSTAIKCDRCGNVVERAKKLVKPYNNTLADVLTANPVDLCENCASDFEYYWNNVVRGERL